MSEHEADRTQDHEAGPLDAVSAAGATPPPAFPLVATISGVPVVTIPLDDYRALLMSRDRLALIRAPAIPFDLPSRSPIETDPVISTFFMERFGRMRMEVIVHECRRAYGKDRTPSRTAAYAYWKRLRARVAGQIGTPSEAVPD